jgi:hypothetical protein
VHPSVTVYVDPLAARGWRLHGRPVSSCHLFTDLADLEDLHAIAAAAGCRRAWFQNARAAPHYDLTPRRREAAIAAGAVVVDRHQAARIWQARRRLVGTPPR